MQMNMMLETPKLDLFRIQCSPHLVVVYFYVCYAAPWRNISRVSKKELISLVVFMASHTAISLKKASTKLLSRQGYLHASARCPRSRESEEMEIFVKIGAEPEIDFLYLHLSRLCGISYFNTLTKIRDKSGILHTVFHPALFLFPFIFSP